MAGARSHLSSSWGALAGGPSHTFGSVQVLSHPPLWEKVIHSKLHTQRMESWLRSTAVLLFGQLYRRRPPVSLGGPGSPWVTKPQAHASVLGLHDNPQRQVTVWGTLVTPFIELISFSPYPRTGRLHPETSAVSTPAMSSRLNDSAS